MGTSFICLVPLLLTLTCLRRTYRKFVGTSDQCLSSSPCRDFCIPLLPVFASIPTNAKNGCFDLADRPWPRLHFPRATPVREIAISPSLDGNASQRPWPCPNKTQPWRPGDRCDRHRQPVQLQPGELDPNWFSRVPGLDASRAFVVYATSTGHPPISKSVSRVQHGGGDEFRFLCSPLKASCCFRLLLRFFL